jgi:membrane protease YdiL (CAAX protease family)
LALPGGFHPVFDPSASAEPPRPVLRLLAAGLLGVFDCLFLALSLASSLLGDAEPGRTVEPLIQAEAGALARMQAIVSRHEPDLAAWLDGPIREALAQLPRSAPETLIWLGETGQRERLQTALHGTASMELTQALEGLYLGSTPPEPSTLAELLAGTQGYFRQAALARSGDSQQARALEEAEGRSLWLLGAVAGLLGALTLAGIAILATAWLWLERVHPRHRFPPPSPGPFSALDVTLLFVGWLALYISLSLVVGALPLARRFVVSSLMLTYLGQALGGWLLLHLLLAPRRRASELFGSILRGAGRPGPGRCLLFALGGYAAALPLLYGAGVVVDLLGGPAPTSENPLIPLLLESGDLGSRIGILVTVAVLAPVFEELLFRGVILPALRERLGPWLAILLSGVLFAAIHLDLRALVPLATLGCLLGYVAHRGGSLVPAILVHALWNSQAFLQIEILRRLA